MPTTRPPEPTIRGCSPRPWSFSPRPPVPRLPSPQVPPTRCSGYTGSWAPASHWAAPAVSCFAPPPGETRGWPAPPGKPVACAMQLAIGLLTGGLDSLELELWAADALTPRDADGLGNFMVGLHVFSGLLLSELHEATGEPQAAIL